MKSRPRLTVIPTLLLTAFGCAAQTFSVTATPSSITIYPGQQNLPVNVSVNAGSYSGPIGVTMFGLPSGITFVPLTIAGSGSGTILLNASTAAGQEGFDPLYDTNLTSWTAPVTVVAAAGSYQATAQIQVTVSISNPGFQPSASAINLPIVNINTQGVPVIDKTTDVPGTITVTSANGQTLYLPNANDADNTATFHIHGNSTADMPKVPYHIDLNTGVDLLGAMGLNCGYVNKSGPVCDKAKTYDLFANYDDKTFLRTWAAGTLARAIPIGNRYLNSPADSPTPSGTGALVPWAPHGLFVELFLNGAYEGNYLLIEEVKIDSHRVNIFEMSETDSSPSDDTGGYLMEIDNRREEDYVFQTPQGLPIGLLDPDFTPEVPQQTSYITSYVTAAENALFGSSFTDPALGWRAYYDEASAVNWYIVNELMGGVDSGAFNNSAYLYKDANNPLIYMGPQWDFDISAGNAGNGGYGSVVNPLFPYVRAYAPWYVRWFQDPGFKADAATQWNALKANGIFTAWMAAIQTQAAALAQSQANNFQRWPIIGIQTWPNSEVAGSYQGELSYFLNWLNARFGSLDAYFNNKTPTNTSLNIAAGASQAGSPVTLMAQVTGGTNPSGTVTFLSNGVVVGASPLGAAGSATLTLSNPPPGSYDLEAIYNGDTTNGLSVSPMQEISLAPNPSPTMISIAGPFAATGGQSFTAAVLGNSFSAAPTGTMIFSVDAGAGSSVAVAAGQATFVAGGLSAGPHTITVRYSGDTNNAAGASPSLGFQGGQVTSALSGESPDAPALTGIVSAAAEGQVSPEVVAPGSYVAIYGTNLAGAGNPLATSLPLPVTLNGTQVLLNNVPLPLNYAGGTQINALIPQGIAPDAAYPLVVSTLGRGQSAPFMLYVTSGVPGVYSVDGSGTGAGIVTNAVTGALITSSSPAHVGDYLTVYCTGLGMVQGPNGQPAPADGAAAPGSPLYQTVAPVEATIGGIAAQVTFAGLTPTLAGLYQVNVQVPTGVTSGMAASLVISSMDPEYVSLSNPVTVYIQ